MKTELEPEITHSNEHEIIYYNERHVISAIDRDMVNRTLKKIYYYRDENGDVTEITIVTTWLFRFTMSLMPVRFLKWLKESGLFETKFKNKD